MTTKRARNLTANEPTTLVTCGNCNTKVVHIQWVNIGPLVRQMQCDDCFEKSRQTAPDAPKSEFGNRPAVIERIDPATGEIFYEVRPLVFDDAPVDAVAKAIEDPDGAVIGFLAKWYLEHPDALALAVAMGQPAKAAAAPAPVIDFTKKLESKAAWNDTATTFAREQARRFADIYGPLNFKIAFTQRGFFNLEARAPEAIAA